MQYQVSRNGQMYGPYTLEDLQRYLQTGNVLPTDLAKSEEMTDWLPVAQILGISAQPMNAGGSGAQGFGGQGFGVQGFGAQTGAQIGGYVPGMAGAPVVGVFAGAFPDPPNLNWGLVLLFDVLTCGIFQMVWNIMMAAWFRRVSGNAKVLTYYIVSAVLLLVQGIAAQAVGFIAGSFGAGRYNGGTVNAGPHAALLGLYGLLVLGTWIIRLVARFTFRAELEKHYNGPEPLGLRLSGVMTFFFGGIYFQYHLNRINEMKQALRFRNAAL